MGRPPIVWSDVFRLAGPYGRSGLSLEVCERQERFTPSETSRWPAGNYCILRASNQNCPQGKWLQNSKDDPNECIVSVNVVIVINEMLSWYMFA